MKADVGDVEDMDAVMVIGMDMSADMVNQTRVAKVVSRGNEKRTVRGASK
jgi:hypothetical protein